MCKQITVNTHALDETNLLYIYIMYLEVCKLESNKKRIEQIDKKPWKNRQSLWETSMNTLDTIDETHGRIDKKHQESDEHHREKSINNMEHMMRTMEKRRIDEKHPKTIKTMWNSWRNGWKKHGKSMKHMEKPMIDETWKNNEKHWKP